MKKEALCISVCNCSSVHDCVWVILNAICLNNCYIYKYRSINPLCTGHPKRGTLANSVDPYQMPQNVASDQGLHCLLTRFSIKNRIKATK